MMQSELLDITIIGCLVLLFASTYRKRPSYMVRAWILGWVLILVHFIALLFHPDGITAARAVTLISLVALFACGIVFLSAPPGGRQSNYGISNRIFELAGLGILASTAMDVWEIHTRSAYFGAGALVTAAWLIYGFGLRDVSGLARALWFLSVFATSGWFDWAIWSGQPDVALSALATQIFMLVGVAYIGTVRRTSTGTITVSIGLVAWAAVFPVAQLLQRLHLGGRIHPEFWNVPKYFVAFGMILMLLEDEIIAANDAGAVLLFRASHDQLTGLRNRSALEQDLGSAVASAGQRSERCALICFDLDRFKHINDTYGHGVGDICLKTAGARLSQFASDRRMPARIGGEEFALVLSTLSEPDEAEVIARQLLQALREPVLVEAFLIEITASVGIAVFPDDGLNPATLWRNADTAMYRAKKAGGNQIVSMSPEILRFSSESNDMERSLRRALRENGLELHFQPIFGAEGNVHSVEALVRLRHPELGLILPARFITVAEERGLIVPLGEWVLKAVCEQLSSWRNRGIVQVPIAMNISALQITSPNFSANVLEMLSQFRIDPSLIAMEITETAMLRNAMEASRQIDILAAAGISFSVDDFGVGYSSLGQLDKLKVNYLKIDHSFVSRIGDVQEARSIVAAIISMAHSMGLKVVAEGIESQWSLDRLTVMGCDLFQGFFLGRPLPSEDLELLLLQEQARDGAVAQVLKAEFDVGHA